MRASSIQAGFTWHRRERRESGGFAGGPCPPFHTCVEFYFPSWRVGLGHRELYIASWTYTGYVY